MQEKPGWGRELSSKSTEGGQGEAKEQRSDQPKISQLLSLPLLIQNIRLYYWCSTREHILCSGDSLHFPENTMERVSQCKVTDLPLDLVQAKLLTSHFVFPEAQQVHMVGESTGRVALPAKSQDLGSFRISNHRWMRPANRLGKNGLGKEARRAVQWVGNRQGHLPLVFRFTQDCDLFGPTFQPL